MPTPFWQTKVEGVDNEPIKKYCYEIRDNTEGVVISNRGGWHSKEILQPIPDELKTFSIKYKVGQTTIVLK